MLVARTHCLSTKGYREHPFPIIPLHLSSGIVVSATVVSATSDPVNDEIDSGEKDVAAIFENSYTFFIQEQRRRISE